jgi:hypothetical protein
MPLSLETSAMAKGSVHGGEVLRGRTPGVRIVRTKVFATLISWIVEVSVQHMRYLIVAACLYPLSAGAQQQQQQPAEWAKLPRMQLERQFAGPLQDTVIQRWRDPVDGVICYLYLPITAPHSPPTASGYVQYGSNTIGSLSCIAAPSARASSAPSAGKASEPVRTAPSPAATAPKER